MYVVNFRLYLLFLCHTFQRPHGLSFPHGAPVCVSSSAPRRLQPRGSLEMFSHTSLGALHSHVSLRNPARTLAAADGLALLPQCARRRADFVRGSSFARLFIVLNVVSSFLNRKNPHHRALQRLRLFFGPCFRGQR